jgi:hypothetical protein
MSIKSKSELVAEYQHSPFALIWRWIWTLFPGLLCQTFAFFFFDDGTVLWNQGFGYIAFLQGNRSLTIRWSLENPATRVIHLSIVHHWDPPHQSGPLSDEQFARLKERLTERFRVRGENTIFR